eukprot:2873621-Rhodomonas_salina.2
MKSEPEMERKGTLASPAIAFAISVLPVPFRTPTPPRQHYAPTRGTQPDTSQQYAATRAAVLLQRTEVLLRTDRGTSATGNRATNNTTARRGASRRGAVGSTGGPQRRAPLGMRAPRLRNLS